MKRLRAARESVSLDESLEPLRLSTALCSYVPSPLHPGTTIELGPLVAMPLRSATYVGAVVVLYAAGLREYTNVESIQKD
jgi:hypothetical protein